MSKAYTAPKGVPTLSRAASIELRRASVKAMRAAGEVIRIGGHFYGPNLIEEVSGTVPLAETKRDFDKAIREEISVEEITEELNTNPWDAHPHGREADTTELLPDMRPRIYEVQVKGNNGKYTKYDEFADLDQAKVNAAFWAEEGQTYRVFNTETGKPVGKPYKG